MILNEPSGIQNRRNLEVCVLFMRPIINITLFSWKIFRNKITKFIKNDIYRRQDLPKAYYHFHYISCFKVSEVKKLNSEMINKKNKTFIN